MKVKCVVLCDSEGKPVEFSPWLTVGRIYHVVSVLTYKNGGRKYQIVTSDQARGAESLGYYPSSCFEIVSNYRPACWQDRIIGEVIETSPAAWQAEGFFEALYDGDPAANLAFERERNAIFADEP